MSSAHRFRADEGLSSGLLVDPGNGKALPIDSSGVIPIKTGASGETNTLARPLFVDQQLTLVFDTDGGGDRVITVAGGCDASAHVTITFATARQCLVLIGTQLAGVKCWSLLSNDGSVSLA